MRAAIPAAALFTILAACIKAPDGHPPPTALADLRQTQMLLRMRDEPEVMRQIRPADEEVEAAIRSLEPPGPQHVNGAAPEFNPTLSRLERFQRALALLSSARAKIAGTEQAAVRHIDEAAGALRRASEALGIGLNPSNKTRTIEN